MAGCVELSTTKFTKAAKSPAILMVERRAMDKGNPSIKVLHCKTARYCIVIYIMFNSVRALGLHASQVIKIDAIVELLRECRALYLIWLQSHHLLRTPRLLITISVKVLLELLKGGFIRFIVLPL